MGVAPGEELYGGPERRFNSVRGSAAKNAGPSDTATSPRTAIVTIAGLTLTITQAGSSPTIGLDRTSLVCSAVNTGFSLTAKTGTQSVRFDADRQRYGDMDRLLHESLATRVAHVGHRVGHAQHFDAVRLWPRSVQTGRINVTLGAAGNAIGPINVTFTVVSSTAAVSSPFGVFDTPVGDATVLAGSIAVTGWALDNVGVKRVEIWRDLQAGETTPPFASGTSDPRRGKVFISNATFVEGARPDVEGLNPTVPFAYRAGWGYLLLTRGLWNQGNGTYKLYAAGFLGRFRVVFGSGTERISVRIIVVP